MGGGDTGDTSVGIGNSLQFAVVYLYEVAFADLRVGYASAMGWVLFAVDVGLYRRATKGFD